MVATLPTRVPPRLPSLPPTPQIAAKLPQRTVKSVWAAGTRMFHEGNYQVGACACVCETTSTGTLCARSEGLCVEGVCGCHLEAGVHCCNNLAKAAEIAW